jgi:putative NADH-flavin reductase
MRIAVFGATGQLGRQCVRQALDLGHSVTVLARTPAKLNDEFRRRVDIVPGDPSNFGARVVRGFAARFMGLRHRDKDHQLAYLLTRTDIDWFGVRPLRMGKGERMGTYRLGMDRFSGVSKISFGDCADAMIGMLDDDRWRHQAPIIQY